MELGTNFAAKLEPFLLMGKSMKGAAAAKLVEDATSAPGVFVFSELLDMPNIQELAKSEQHAKYFALLELFAYKTYQDYIQQKDKYPTLNQAQIAKLKHLSIVTMATERRILPYEDLMKALDMPAIRELEDLIIDAIYLEVVRGKLDQKEGQLEVEYTVGRDLEPGRLESVLAALKNWAQTTSDVLATLDNKIQAIGSHSAAVKTRRQDQENAVQATLKEVLDKQQKDKGGARKFGSAGYVDNDFRGVMRSGVAMDIDEPMEKENLKGKNRKAEAAPGAKPVRKRNRM